MKIEKINKKLQKIKLCATLSVQLTQEFKRQLETIGLPLHKINEIKFDNAKHNFLIEKVFEEFHEKAAKKIRCALALLREIMHFKKELLEYNNETFDLTAEKEHEWFFEGQEFKLPLFLPLEQPFETVPDVEALDENDDPYQFLGIDRDASPEQIEQAYYAKCVENHPDKKVDVIERANAIKFCKKLDLCFAILINPETKIDLDKKLACQSQRSAASSHAKS